MTLGVLNRMSTAAADGYFGAEIIEMNSLDAGQ